MKKTKNPKFQTLNRAWLALCPHRKDSLLLKLILFTCLFLLIQIDTIAQPCLPEGITFTLQEEIDSFSVNYPGCSVIEGSVHIVGEDIQSLDGLWVLDEIGGDLVIGEADSTGTSITDLFGLNYLTAIGGDFIIQNNPLLENLIGISNLVLDSLNSLTIINNPELSLCDVHAICNFLALPAPQVNIHDNGPDCENPEAVQLDCENNCLPQGIYFGTQYEIDMFKANHPGCTEIEGFVTIEGDNISSLLGLNDITTIQSRLLIGRLYPTTTNINLIDLNGLENLTFIGGFLAINWNTSLVSCSGLNNLKHVGDYLSFWGNGSLINLAGFENLEMVDGGINIHTNYELEDLSGLNSLSYIGEGLGIQYNYNLHNLNGINPTGSVVMAENMIISQNPVLTDIYGLQNFEFSSGAHLVINANGALSSCDALSICEFMVNSTGTIQISGNAFGCNNNGQVLYNCQACLPNGITLSTQEQIDNFQVTYEGCKIIQGPLIISGGDDITNLNGLNVLERVEEGLYIYDNINLEDLSGLDNISSIGSELVIHNNEVLDKISALSNIDPESIEYLEITSNPLLSNCAIQSICGFVVSLNVNADINYNAAGCNTIYEVHNACWTATAENNAGQFCKIFPNPTADWIIIETATTSSTFDFIIQNVIGQVEIHKSNISSPTHAIDLSELTDGVYFYTVMENDITVGKGKIIKNKF